MSNLGDSNTPVEGESFGLPAGAELGEDDGDLVIQDSGGTIILRRDETAGEWQFENTDLTGINSIDAGSANLESGTIATESTDPNAIARFSQVAEAEALIAVESTADLPEIQEPAFAYIEEADDYAGVFKS